MILRESDSQPNPRMQVDNTMYIESKGGNKNYMPQMTSKLKIHDSERGDHEKRNCSHTTDRRAAHHQPS